MLRLRASHIPASDAEARALLKLGVPVEEIEVRGQPKRRTEGEA